MGNVSYSQCLFTSAMQSQAQIQTRATARKVHQKVQLSTDKDILQGASIVFVLWIVLLLCVVTTRSEAMKNNPRFARLVEDKSAQGNNNSTGIAPVPEKSNSEEPTEQIPSKDVQDTEAPKENRPSISSSASPTTQQPPQQGPLQEKKQCTVPADNKGSPAQTVVLHSPTQRPAQLVLATKKQSLSPANDRNAAQEVTTQNFSRTTENAAQKLAQVAPAKHQQSPSSLNNKEVVAQGESKKPNNMIPLSSLKLAQVGCCVLSSNLTWQTVPTKEETEEVDTAEQWTEEKLNGATMGIWVDNHRTNHLQNNWKNTPSSCNPNWKMSKQHTCCNCAWSYSYKETWCKWQSTLHVIAMLWYLLQECKHDLQGWLKQLSVSAHFHCVLTCVTHRKEYETKFLQESNTILPVEMKAPINGKRKRTEKYKETRTKKSHEDQETFKKCSKSSRLCLRNRFTILGKLLKNQQLQSPQVRDQTVLRMKIMADQSKTQLTDAQCEKIYDTFIDTGAWDRVCTDDYSERCNWQCRHFGKCFCHCVEFHGERVFQKNG